MLVAVIFMLAILIISMAVAVPMVRKSIQRDREVETMQRGKQYVRAIQLYYRKFHRYPPNIDALVKTNEIRFLRKRYTDPMTGKDDWKPIQFGQNKTPLAVGFFGQALGGAVGAGTGPGGVTGATSAGSIGLGGSAGSGPAGSGSFGGSSSGSGGLGGGGSSFSSGSSFSGNGSPSSGSSFSSGNSGFGASGGGGGGSQITSGSTPGTPGTSSGGSSDTGTASSSSSGLNSSMQTFGGGGHRRLFPRQREAIDSDLQEEGPLQPMGIHLQPPF